MYLLVYRRKWENHETKNQVQEEKEEVMAKQGPCWDGYVQKGMKSKGGRMVPNCVPVGKTVINKKRKK